MDAIVELSQRELDAMLDLAYGYIDQPAFVSRWVKEGWPPDAAQELAAMVATWPAPEERN